MELKYSPDAKRLQSAGMEGDATIRVWELEEGKQIARIERFRGQAFDAHEPDDDSSFSPDGERLLFYRFRPKKQIVVWSLKSNAPQCEIDIEGRWADEAVFSPDGRHVISRHRMGIWDADTGVLENSLFQGEFTSAKHPQRRELLISNATDSLPALCRLFKNYWYDGKVAEDGSSAATLFGNAVGTVWDLETGKRRCKFRMTPMDDLKAISADGSYLLISGQTAAATIECATGRKSVLRHFYYPKFSPKASRILDQKDDGQLGGKEWIEVYDRATGALCGELPEHGWVISGNESRIFRASATPGMVQVVDFPTLQPLAEIPAVANYSLAVSEDGSHFAVAMNDNSIQEFIRTRPEQWWGVAWMVEFWLTLALAVGVMASVWRDWRGR